MKLASLLLVFALNVYSAEILRWNFEDDFTSAGYVLDRSGNGNHGWQMNVTNRLVRDTSTKATRLAAASFITNFYMTDGVNTYPASQYLAVTNTASPLYANLTNGSVSFWVKFLHKNYQPVTYLVDAINRTDVSTTNGFRIGRLVSPHVNQVEMRIATAVTTDSDGDLAVRASSYSIDGTTDTSTAGFRHYVFTWDCTLNASKVYTNGVLNATGTTTNAQYLRVAPGPTWMCVGANRHGNGTPAWGDDAYPNDCYHYGWLDDLRIFNHTLSESEVWQVYNDWTKSQAVISNVNAGAIGMP